MGESWEFSVEPSFPSHSVDGQPLAALIDSDRQAWLGRSDVNGTPLLVKLLDAAEALSVQIHPTDRDPALGATESGKPEAWYVVDADPDAGIYLGWSEGVDEARVRGAVTGGEDVSALMHFVRVLPGDYVVIEAGTPHAIGPGVFLVEPQRVQPERTGTTYRYWDWNRRYDAAGQPDAGGEPRRLDLERALSVTRWDLPRGESLLDRIRHRAGPPRMAEARVEVLRAPHASTPLSTARVSGSGSLPLPFGGQLRALTVLAGRATVGGAELGPGHTAAVPACFEGLVQLTDAHATVCACELAPPPG
ncbi:MAG: type I phosphomannose isomerase catalytic subunit [Sandaracinaceae bacterium]